MDKLSYEIISLIVGNIDGPLAPYAVLSRAWQSVVETRTFSRVRVESSSVDIFDSALAPAHGRRRNALKKLCFEVDLPKSNEVRADYRKNLGIFRQAVAAFFQRLAAWKGTGNHLELAVSAMIAYDNSQPDNTRELEEQGFCVLDYSGVHDGRSAGGRRYLALRDTDIQAIGTVSCVHTFVVDNSGLRIHPTTAFSMTRCFEGLEELSLSYADPVKRRRALRQEHRQAVADGVKSLRELPCLKKLHIKGRDNKDPIDHAFDIQDFRNDQGVDALCEAIRCLAQAGKLVELHLEDTLVSPDLFQDQSLPPGERQAIPWPSLERFSICQGIAAPDGRWYATGDPAQDPTDSPANTYASPPANFGRMYDSDDTGVDSEELSDDDGDDEGADVLANGEAPDHRWRTHIDADVFDPLALAMAAAVLVMPKLQKGTVMLGMDTGLLPYVLECAEPGQEMQWDEYIAMAPVAARGRRWRVIVHEGACWEPSKELQALWDAWIEADGTAETVVFEELDAYGVQYLSWHGTPWRQIRRRYSRH